MTLFEGALTTGIALLGGGHVWTWLASRGKQQVDLIELSERIAAATIVGLDTRIKELEDKVDALSAHVEVLEGVIRQLGETPPPRPTPRAKLVVSNV